MSVFIASPAHYERLLGNDGISLKELAASVSPALGLPLLSSVLLDELAVLAVGT